MTPFDQFKLIVERFGWIAGLALAGGIFAPIVAEAAGIAPTYPASLPFITSLFMLLTLVLIFTFASGMARKPYRRLLLAAVLAFILSLGGYLYSYDRFQYRVPGSTEIVTLGCGWKSDARRVARQMKIDPQGECPGEFAEILNEAENIPDNIWAREGLGQIRLLLVALWLMIFVSLTAAIGAFAAYLSRKPRAATAAK